MPCVISDAPTRDKSFPLLWTPEPDSVSFATDLSQKAKGHLDFTIVCVCLSVYYVCMCVCMYAIGRVQYFCDLCGGQT